MEFPEIPLWRLTLFLSRQLLSYAMRKELERLEAAPEREGVVIFEGLFNLVKASLVFTRLGEDVAVTGFHCVPIRAGLPADTEATNAETDKIAARVATWWGVNKALYVPETVLDRVIFHDAGPKVTDEQGRTRGIERDANGKALPGQAPVTHALRETVIGVAGTSTDARLMPPQDAITLTLKTQFRRQWGRMYLPAPGLTVLAEEATHVAGAGQIDSDIVDQLRETTANLFEGLDDDDVPGVVWSTKHQHAVSLAQIQVDSLWDVMRSRRYDRPFHVATHTMGT
jgi:hypothetical protein